MSRLGRGLSGFLIIAAILVPLAACSSASSNTAASAGGTRPAAVQTRAGTGAGNGSDLAFCQALAQAQTDSQGVANGSKKADDVRAEIERVRQDAPAAIRSDVITLMDVNLAFINRDPSFAQKSHDPGYLAAQDHFHAWAAANCP